MAEPTELELLRQATQLWTQCSDFISGAEKMQTERWSQLRRVIADASTQYAGMRHDVLEESLADEGTPMWLSAVLAVAVSIIPVTAHAEALIDGLTGGVMKALKWVASKQTVRIAGLETRLERELIEERLKGALRQYEKAKRLQDRIKVTEEAVWYFAQKWKPELASVMQDGAQELGKIAYKYAFETKATQSGGREFFNNTDMPVVLVTQVLNRWIDRVVTIEDTARNVRRTYVRDLFDIATAKDPRKEAEEKERAALEALRDPRVPFRNPAEVMWLSPRIVKLPATRKAALDELTASRDELVPPRNEQQGIGTGDLRELQLIVESLMWACTYDFSWRKGDATKLTPLALEPAPLPKGLWKRLVTRYIDPDEKKSFKELGPLSRLGTQEKPFFDLSGRPGTKEASDTRGKELATPGDKFSPEVRLSHYFRYVLYEELVKENNEVTKRFARLGGR